MNFMRYEDERDIVMWLIKQNLQKLNPGKVIAVTACNLDYSVATVDMYDPENGLGLIVDVRVIWQGEGFTSVKEIKAIE